MYIYCIKVTTEGGSQGGDDVEEDNDVITNNVAMNLKQNQVMISRSNDIKYYNTNELNDIDIENETGKITVTTTPTSRISTTVP